MRGRPNWLLGRGNIVEREGVIKFLTVRNLIFVGSVAAKRRFKVGVKGAPGQGTGPTMAVLRTVYIRTVYTDGLCSGRPRALTRRLGEF